MTSFFSEKLQQLAQIGQRRAFPQIEHQSKWIQQRGQNLLNLSSNDYLGIAAEPQFLSQFLAEMSQQPLPLTSSSSRLLTGNFPIYETLEQRIAQDYQRQACLLFNSGYHANIGILPAVTDRHTLIVADKLVHASIIDGIRLSECKWVRYRHNDYQHLSDILQKQAADYQRIIIVTESVFSMDGDIVDLAALTALKQQYDNVLLYVDEAHAVGVFGEKGLGIAEQQGYIDQIDFLVGTFGKALASMGAFVVCDQAVKDYLINTMRPLIFSTALPPLNVAWSYFIWQQLANFHERRQHLANISQQLRTFIQQTLGLPMPSATNVVPYIVGENQRALEVAQRLQQRHFYALPIRPPTVPKGTARIRFSLTAAINEAEIAELMQTLKELA
ncbi:8-amino-7-oxononanoate synthase [Gallibacterium anatis]|uniref:aminotransferase class I/II-fold pyridoxal phosphate-dependent enzyme n=1 Tax=Gallibacterium anatis TaxID=750 RepID=UPI002550DEF9|nr:8-amino-7-oxononanoate synthase [Gallibacterium anatis]MDK9561743.1 8-amino-7-oxononanoate synthase [Gallibacterium anatis]